MAKVSISGDKVNNMTVSVGDLTIYFSYETPVGYFFPGEGTVVRQNDWSTTTGKHINAIDGGDKEAKANRLSGIEFKKRLDDITARIGV